MLKRLFVISLLCASALGISARGQLLSVTATLTDSDSTVWANATCRVTPYNTQGGASYYNGTAIPTNPPCTVNGSGVLSASLYITSTLNPSSTEYRFSIQSATSAAASVFLSPVTSSNLTSVLSALIIAPRFSAGYNAFGYADVEAQTGSVGQTYYNTVTPAWRQCTAVTSGACSTWATVSGGSSGVTEIIPGTNITCSPNSGGHCVGNVTVNASGGGGSTISLTASTAIAAGTGVSVNSSGQAQQTWGPAPNVAGVVTVATGSITGFPGINGGSGSGLLPLSSSEYIGWQSGFNAVLVPVSKSGIILTVGTPNAFLGSTGVGPIVPLTSSTFIATNAQNTGNTYFCSISAGVITPGALNAIGGDGVIAGARLSNSTFVLLLANGTAVVGSVSGSTITYGTPVTIGSGSFNNFSVQLNVLGSAAFVVVFGDGSSSNVLTAVAATVASTIITTGSTYTIPGTVAGYFSPSGTLSSSSFVTAYTAGFGENQVFAVVGSVSGTVVTFGTSELISNNSTAPSFNDTYNFANYIPTAVLSSTEVVFGAGGVLSQICTISGTSISIPTSVPLTNVGYLSNLVPIIERNNSTVIINSVVSVGSYLLISDGAANIYETDGTTNYSPYVEHSALFNYGLTASDSTTAVAWFNNFNGDFQARVITTEPINPTPPIGITSAGASISGTVAVTPKGQVVTGLSGLTAGTLYYHNGDGTLVTANTGHPAGVALSATTLLVQ